MLTTRHRVEKDLSKYGPAQAAVAKHAESENAAMAPNTESPLWKLETEHRKEFFASRDEIDDHVAQLYELLKQQKERLNKLTGNEMVYYLVDNLVKNSAIAAGFFLFLGALHLTVESFTNGTLHGNYLTFEDVLVNGVKLSVVIVVLGVPVFAGLRSLCRRTRLRPDHALVLGLLGAIGFTAIMPLVFYQAEPEYRIYAGAEGFSGRIVEKFQDGIVIKGSEHDMLTRVAAWLGGFVTETWANVVPDGYNSPEASEQGTSRGRSSRRHERHVSPSQRRQVHRSRQRVQGTLQEHLHFKDRSCPGNRAPQPNNLESLFQTV